MDKIEQIIELISTTEIEVYDVFVEYESEAIVKFNTYIPQIDRFDKYQSASISVDKSDDMHMHKIIKSILSCNGSVLCDKVKDIYYDIWPVDCAIHKSIKQNLPLYTSFIESYRSIDLYESSVIYIMDILEKEFKNYPFSDISDDVYDIESMIKLLQPINDYNIKINDFVFDTMTQSLYKIQNGTLVEHSIDKYKQQFLNQIKDNYPQFVESIAKVAMTYAKSIEI